MNTSTEDRATIYDLFRRKFDAVPRERTLDRLTAMRVTRGTPQNPDEPADALR